MFCVTMYITCQQSDILYTYQINLVQALDFYSHKLTGWYEKPVITEIFTLFLYDTNEDTMSR